MSTATLNDSRLRIGSLTLDVPVVLAPMAGITNTAFRRLCREYGAGLYVSEMITSRALVERTPASLRLIKHHESETPRSIQLYGVEPKTVSEAVRFLVDEDLADHIDLNFGCPVPKVTRKGGGSALPWKSDLFQAIVEGAVKAAGEIPLTVKMRKGIDEDHLTYLDAARAAEGAGVAAIALHGRTASEFYSGRADWSAIAALKQAITSVPILGNGDIWSADDAIRMVEETGCDGVVVGRGCLGRPWLFGDLAAAFRAEAGEISRADAEQAIAKPPLGFVMQAMRRHAELLIEFFDGDEDLARASLDRLWQRLTDGGIALMPLGEYPFSAHYGWVQDRYGVSWQLMLTDPAGDPRPFVMPALMFGERVQNHAGEAVGHYLDAFSELPGGAELGAYVLYPEKTGPAEPGTVMFSDFRIGDQWFVAMDSGVSQSFTFSCGVSLEVRCDGQGEIDGLWESLSAVPEAEQCGWLADRFGVSWQIVPDDMDELMRRPGAFEKMLRMKKIVVDEF